MTDQLPDRGRPWPLYGAIALAVLLIGLAFYFGGRNIPSTPHRDDAGTGQSEQEGCDEKLAEVLAAIDPIQLEISSSVQDRTLDLNLWREECARKEIDRPITNDADVLQKLLPRDVAASAEGNDYVGRDVRHIRTSLLLREAAEHVAGKLEDPLQQAVALFEYVQRNVLDFPVPPPGAKDDAPPAMSLYEVLCCGRGSAAQRGWLFVELLRQIRLDAVVIEPRQAAGDAGEPRVDSGVLFGVPIKAGDSTRVYLFDTSAGVPLPGPGETESTAAFITRPATLAEVRADDGLLRQLDLEGSPYPLTAARLQNVRVGIVGNASLWSERMAELQFLATDLREAVLFDGLGPNRLQKEPLTDRITRAGADGGWEAGDVFVWEFPERQLAGYEATPHEQQPWLANMNAILNAPKMRDVSDGSNTIVWRQSLRDARNWHLSGAYQEAIDKYRNIRSSLSLGTYEPSPLNDYARDCATYWTAVCQYELGEDGSVINTTSRATYPPEYRNHLTPLWPDGAFRLAVLSLARLGLWNDAATLLRSVAVRDAHGTAYLIRRWDRLGKPATPLESPQPAAGAAPTPETQPAPAAQSEILMPPVKPEPETPAAAPMDQSPEQGR